LGRKIGRLKPEWERKSFGQKVKKPSLSLGVFLTYFVSCNRSSNNWTPIDGHFGVKTG